MPEVAQYHDDNSGTQGSGSRSLLSSFSPAASLNPPSSWELQAFQGLLNSCGWTPISRLWSLESSTENLLVGVRSGGALQPEGEGAGKGWEPGAEGFVRTPVDTGGRLEAYCFLLLSPCPRTGKSAHEEGEDRKRVPAMACLPPLHPGGRRYGLSAAPLSLELSRPALLPGWVRWEGVRSSEVQRHRGVTPQEVYLAQSQPQLQQLWRQGRCWDDVSTYTVTGA